ncbi:cell division protein FtsX [Marivita geojedonensis]|uniref:Cell division protein FtsX n=1 Tax=Marivita geojedonensis TaxID=1123756 RepID=A0A1X4NQ58_9RHOB|nr:cell division protein FtsX [Marivita geojedonensis]OSQ53060.1 cell division protein FtsX [Marivita geojedonensis]PRY82027.1 cell division transport system permease protein [Marivita geojedonensis]
MFDLRSTARMLKFDEKADRVVPPTGFTARLTLFSAFAMSFLAVFALALSLAAGRVADRWGEELAQSSTLRISAPAGEVATQTEAALRVLRTTPGIIDARALSTEEQRALLAPWFGSDLPIEDLPLPQLIDIIETDEGYDAAGLRLRLAAEAPAAVLDDHARWRRPLIDAAGRLRLLGWASILLIATATGAMVTLAANAALAANAQVIAVLRLVGAKDTYIASAFVRRFALRALTGAAFGTLTGIVALFLIPAGSDTTGFLTDLSIQGWGWVWVILIPPLSGLVAFFATRFAAGRVLEDLA